MKWSLCKALKRSPYITLVFTVVIQNVADRMKNEEEEESIE